jgi:large subunit ribosomal protein L21
MSCLTNLSARSASSSGPKQGKTLKLPLMVAEPGAKITFDEVLLSSDGTTITAGAPLVKGAKVMAEVVGHGKDEKL